MLITVFLSYVKQVQTQVLHGQQKGGARALEEQKHNEKKEKKKKQEASALLASLFKNAQGLQKNANDAAIKES